MFDQQAVSRKLREHYDAVWNRPDPWNLDNSEFEKARYARQIALLGDQRYGRVLEVGCGAGAFTRLLAPLTEELLALDVAPAAIERAQRENSGLRQVRFQASDIMEFDLSAVGPWDLIVMSETIYCLGWLYPLFNVGWLLSQCRESLRDNGRFLLANTYGGPRDFLLLPWLIETYRDLMVNVGFKLEREEVFRDVKEGVEFEVLMSLFTKFPGQPAEVAPEPSSPPPPGH